MSEWHMIPPDDSKEHTESLQYPCNPREAPKITTDDIKWQFSGNSNMYKVTAGHLGVVYNTMDDRDRDMFIAELKIRIANQR